MAINKKFYWKSAELSGYTVKLIQDGRAWAHASNVTASYDSGLAAYVFSYDATDTAIYDPIKVYDIWTSNTGAPGSKSVEDIDLGDVATAEDLDDHEALSAAVHGTIGTVVGTSDIQTLTNKTIDFDPDAANPNLPSNFPADSMMVGDNTDADTYHPAVMIAPTADDALLIIDDSDDTGVGYVTIQAAKKDKTADRNLKLVCEEVVLADKDGNAIQLSGLAAGAANGDAVRYDEFNALDTRVTNLEVGDPWGGTPTISLRLSTSRGARGVGGGNVVTAVFDAGEGFRDKVARWEVFWSSRGILGTTAGATSTATYDYLLANANRTIVRGNEGTSLSLLATGGALSVCVVAFDSDGVDYNSDVVNVGDFGGAQRDAAGNVVAIKRVVMARGYDAAATSASVAAEFVAWLQSTATPTIKRRAPYVYDENDVRMRIYMDALTTAGTGYIKIAIMETGTSTEIASATHVVTNTAYQSTPAVAEIDLTTGFTDGVLYEIEVSTWNASTNTTTLKYKYHGSS